MAIEKFCTRCGRKFLAVGREVICPACKEAAAEESKKAAVERAKMASWRGESVPVRISGRASTIIRRYGAEKSLPFAAALDDLLKSSDFFKSMGKAWEEVEPYKSHRRDKHATEDAQGKQDAPQAAKQEVKQAAKTSTSKATAGKATSKAVTGKAAGKAGKKA